MFAPSHLQHGPATLERRPLLVLRSSLNRFFPCVVFLVFALSSRDDHQSWATICQEIPHTLYARMEFPAHMKTGEISRGLDFVLFYERAVLCLYLYQEELAKEAETGGGGRGGLVLMGPALIPQELRFLVVYVFSAQGLPGFSSVGIPSVNALVQVRAQNPRRTKKMCETDILHTK